MTKPAAFRASYSDLKLIKTRGCVQIVFELPLADFDAAYELLGGMPNPSSERWFAIAALKTEVGTVVELRPSDKRDWHNVQPAAQAGIRCNEPTFIAFLKETRPFDWREGIQAAECVRLICGVKSRAELGTDQRARVIWHQLDQTYQAWKERERS